MTVYFRVPLAEEGWKPLLLYLSELHCDLCLQYFVEAGAMAVRRVKKADLKRIAKATGASFITSLSNLEGEESFDASFVGEAAEVVQETVCDDELILIKG